MNFCLISAGGSIFNPYLYRFCSDYGLYTYVFAKYFSLGHLNISTYVIDPDLFQLMYDALLWGYGKRKLEVGVISESEVTRKIVSRFGAPKVAMEYVSISSKCGSFKVCIKKEQIDTMFSYSNLSLLVRHYLIVVYAF